MESLSQSKNKRSIKILLLGENRVGKTSLARRFLGQDFSPEYHETIGVNISYIDFTNRMGEDFTIMFWDLAGTEKFRLMRKMYFQGAHGIFLIWDVSRPETKNDLYQWFEGISEEKLQDISVAILGNKIDLLDEDESCESLAESLEADLNVWSAIDFQTSALTGENIQDALDWLSRESLYHLNKQKSRRDSIFDPSNYPQVLFKLSTTGVEPLFLDNINLYHVPESELEAFLMNLGIKISIATGQGEAYTEGVSNLIEEAKGGNRNRLLIYSFRLIDEEVEDPRMRNNYLQFVVFIAKQYYQYFDSFRKVEPLLNEYFSQFNDVKDITYEHTVEARNLVIKKFNRLSDI